MKYEDLKCEFCDGSGEYSRDNSDGVAVEGDCCFCIGTGIDDNQLQKLFTERYSKNPCRFCGCSIDAHSQDGICPQFFAGQFYGWLETKFSLK